MIDWKEIRLKQLIEEVGDGGTPSTFDPNNFGKGIPWVVVEDIKPEISSTKGELTEKGLNSCSAKKWPIGSIILSTGATIGEVGIARVELCTKQGITGIIPNDYADNLFLRFWFEQNKQQLIRYAQGTTFKEIRPRTLGNLRIKVPKPFTEESVVEQCKIASILTKVDNAIQAVKNTIEKAERLKKSLMQNLLTGKLKPDGTRRTDDEFYEDEKFGKIPVGWLIDKGIKLTSKITKGQSPNWQGFKYQTSGLLFITSENIRNSYLDLNPIKYLPMEFNNKIKNSQLQENDILFNIVGASIARSCIYNLSNVVANINQAVCLLRFKSEYEPRYFLYYLQLNDTINRLLSGQVETARANLALGDFRKFRFVYPANKTEQEAIANKIYSAEKIIITKQQKIQKLERIKKSLMQNLLTGKVRVKI